MPSAKLPSCYVFGVTQSGIEPRPPAPRADALTTILRRGGPRDVGSGPPGAGSGLAVHRHQVIVVRPANLESVGGPGSLPLCGLGPGGLEPPQQFMLCWTEVSKSAQEWSSTGVQ